MPGQATVTIKDKQWQVYLATTPQELARGLGGLPGIPPGTGMLFDAGVEQFIRVTTIPMLFPLDVLWISGELKVVDIGRNIPPGYLLTPEAPARYFLEVNAGETEGIEIGDPVSLQVLVAPAQAQQISLVNFALTLPFVFFLFGITRSFVREALSPPQEKPALMPKTGEEYVWVRLGDVAEYENFDTPLEAGKEVGRRLPKKPVPTLKFVSGGVEIEPHFAGRNYVSLYWGDQDAGWIRDLGEKEKKDFETGFWLTLGAHRKRAPAGEFQIGRDRYGAIVITRSDEPKKSVYLQFDVDQKLVLDLLTEKERRDLEEGRSVVIRDNEPRASILEELWETAAEEELEYLPQTEKPAVSREELRKLVDRWAEELKIKPGTLAVVNIIMPELPHLVAHLKTKEDAVKLARKIHEETGLPTKAYLATHSGIVFWQSPNYPSTRKAGEEKSPQVQYLPKTEEGGEYTWTLYDPETGEYMARGGFSTVERARRDAARFAARRAREIGSWLPLVLWIHRMPARELEIGRLDETAVFKGKLEPEARGPRYLPQSFRIEVSAFGPSKVITEGMPRLPEEAYKDWYFVKYIRDLCREAPVSEDEARRYWELWKWKKEHEEEIEERWREKKRRWLEEEQARSPRLLGPERKEEPPEEVRYFADSKDHIEDSVNRNNLRSMLEGAFKEAIARAAEKKIEEVL